MIEWMDFAFDPVLGALLKVEDAGLSHSQVVIMDDDREMKNQETGPARSSLFAQDELIAKNIDRQQSLEVFLEDTDVSLRMTHQAPQSGERE